MHIVRFLILCASLWLGGCITFVGPNYSGCGGYASIADQLACREARGDAFASQQQRAYELQQIREHNVREAARSSVRYDPFNHVYHVDIDCSKAGADASACFEGLEQGKTEELNRWLQTLDQHRDNVRRKEFLKAGGIPRYGYGY